MWEYLLVAILLDKAGFQVERNYEETLNACFIENPEDEFLLELEYVSSDINKSLQMLRPKCENHKFVSVICERLKEIYDNTALEEFESCVGQLWQILPLSVQKDLAQSDVICREIFQDYMDGIDKIIDISEYVSAPPGNVAPDFETAELLLGFKLHESVRNFYSRIFAKKVEGKVNIQAKGFTIPTGNVRFDTWFSFNGIKGRTEFRLFPCTNAKTSAGFIRDSFTIWTGGNDFGERVYIGELFTQIGEISIVINNQTGAVEWVDCEYGQFEKFEKNPHGILADTIESFLQKL